MILALQVPQDQQALQGLQEPLGLEILVLLGLLALRVLRALQARLDLLEPILLYQVLRDQRDRLALRALLVQQEQTQPYLDLLVRQAQQEILDQLVHKDLLEIQVQREQLVRLGQQEQQVQLVLLDPRVQRVLLA